MNANVMNVVSVQEQLRHFASSNSFWTDLELIFGTEYNQAIAQNFRNQWLNNDFSSLPVIKILSSEILGNALGGYAISTNTIYLSDSFLATATSQQITALVLEEIGHFIDANINTVDPEGDEGELFSLLVRGITPGEAELNRIQNENDHETIVIDGQEITIEMGTTITTTTSVDNPITINGTGISGASIDQVGVFMNSGVSVSSTGNATITITGKGWDDSSSGSHAGFWAQSGGFITSVKGAIVINGTAGQGNGSNRGVYLQSGAYISSTDTATITVTGTGSSASTSTGNNGVYVTNTNSRITSLNGNIKITGTSGGGTNTNNGVHLPGGGSISSTGNATITVTGNSLNSTTGTGNRGVNIGGSSTSSTSITSLNGDINVTGTGGGGTSNNQGVFLDSNGSISSTGIGNITVIGIGGSGTSGSDGIGIQNTNSKIQSNTGNISLTGTATGSNFGINLGTNNSIISTSGQISLLGNTINLNNNSTISSGGAVYINSDSDGQPGITTLGATVTVVASTLFLNDTMTVNYNGGATARFDKIQLTGTLDLNGSTLSLDLTGYSATFGQQFTLIDNDGVDVVTGTFSGLAEGATVGTSNSLDVLITYQGGDGNDVQLYIPSNQAPTDLALSANTINENVVIGTGVLIGNITITDADASGNNNVL
ncbi:beta strand repeat-containing protein, partial [Geminocystis sp. GBBB08]|uniref:beta strand repeat-containing protein n=1 Tax=Geminocystis sp. GBBB08 TaxID=2604140 RepID=UPI00292A14EC|nr:hypothetical protein [Geminocystis sp. GBBB08]